MKYDGDVPEALRMAAWKYFSMSLVSTQETLKYNWSLAEMLKLTTLMKHSCHETVKKKK